MIKSGYLNEEKINLDFYHDAGYFSDVHLSNLSFQLNYLFPFKNCRILEIGKGNGFVSNFLKSSGFNVITFDINSALNPDVLGNLKELDKHFAENSFDMVLCSEVLEHIPQEDLETCISQIQRVTTAHALITLPSCRRYLLDLHLYINLPKINPLKPIISIPLGTRPIFADHCWELYSSKSTTPKAIVSRLSNAFKTCEYGRLPFNYYHYFFKLRK